tara:strand:- start:81 stop:311 length:231 start_codon:yes stop_codon:yes gene_type:complete
MNPGGGWRGLSELGYLAFWWAAWSLGDFYLLDWSPWSELWVLGLLGGWTATTWLVERLRTSKRTKAPTEIAIELKE